MHCFCCSRFITIASLFQFLEFAGLQNLAIIAMRVVMQKQPCLDVSKSEYCDTTSGSLTKMHLLWLLQAQEAHQAREAALQAELDALQQRCDTLQ